MNYGEYWTEIDSFARSIMQEEAKKYGEIEDFDDFKSAVFSNLSEYTDAHEYSIYSPFSPYILQHTDSDAEASTFIEGMDLNEIFFDAGVAGIIDLYASFCFHLDVEQELTNLSEGVFNELQDSTN